MDLANVCKFGCCGYNKASDNGCGEYEWWASGLVAYNINFVKMNEKRSLCLYLRAQINTWTQIIQSLKEKTYIQLQVVRII